MGKQGKGRIPQSAVALDPGVAVARIGGEYRLLALTPFAAGERILGIDGETSRQATRYSIQIGEELHIDLLAPRSMEEIFDRYRWRFLNHSCDPNTVVRGHELVALRTIGPWEELTYHYATTEFDMAEPFACRCGSPACLGTVQGFRHLPPTEQRRLQPLLAEHLRRRLEVGEDSLGERLA
jgi:hypothetical protein